MTRGEAGFPRRRRLNRPAQFRRVFAGSLRSSDRFMSVLAVSNTLGFARLGLALSRKAVPLAVNRNRIKRLVRESFRSEQAHLGSIDVVIVGRRGLDQLENTDIRESLKKHWTRLSQRACKPSSSS